jgi:hypothetical protein
VNQPRPLPDEETLNLIKDLWGQGLTMLEIQEHTGIRSRVIDGWRDNQTLSLPKRVRGVNSRRALHRTPTPTEIRARIKNVQRTWSHEEEMLRKYTPRPGQTPKPRLGRTYEQAQSESRLRNAIRHRLRSSQ